jgi:hypothetical protein
MDLRDVVVVVHGACHSAGGLNLLHSQEVQRLQVRGITY